MAGEDNIVKMPDRLERRAQRIEAAMARRERGDREWIEGTIELAVELAGARDDHAGDREFGRWLEGRFGDNRLPHQERAILIRWGRQPDEVRIALENTESRSIQGVDRSLTKASKGPDVGGDKTQAVHAALQANEAAGTKLTQKEIADALGVSISTVGEATRDLKAARSLGLFTYTKAQEQQIEARAKILDKTREAGFEARVVEETKKRIDILHPRLERLEESAKTNEKYYRERLEKIAIFTEAEYRDILFCTHEANPSRETRERAFIALNAKKLQLTGKM